MNLCPSRLEGPEGGRKGIFGWEAESLKAGLTPVIDTMISKKSLLRAVATLKEMLSPAVHSERVNRDIQHHGIHGSIQKSTKYKTSEVVVQ